MGKGIVVGIRRWMEVGLKTVVRKKDYQSTENKSNIESQIERDSNEARDRQTN